MCFAKMLFNNVKYCANESEVSEIYGAREVYSSFCHINYGSEPPDEWQKRRGNTMPWYCRVGMSAPHRELCDLFISTSSIIAHLHICCASFSFVRFLLSLMLVLLRMGYTLRECLYVFCGDVSVVYFEWVCFRLSSLCLLFNLA